MTDTTKTVSTRHALQAQGRHPAPCARMFEATAFEIEKEPVRDMKRMMIWGRLYDKACEVVARIGMDGKIDADNPDVDLLINALHDIDNGERMPGLMPNCVVAPADDARTPADMLVNRGALTLALAGRQKKGQE